MDQDSTINNITTAQNIIQAITNTEVPPAPKENTKNKSDIENEVNTICRNSTEPDQPNENPESKNYIRRQYDQTHKQMGNSEKTKTRMKSFCENLVRIN